MNKKLSFLLLYLIFTIISFSAGKGNMDETQARQNIVNAAMADLGTRYELGTQGDNSTDCSGFAYTSTRGQQGLNGVTGKGRIDTASMRASSSMKQLGKNQLKPGDFIITKPKPGGTYGHVYIFLGHNADGTIEVIDASSGKGKVWKHKISYPPKNYAGVISVTDTIIANGYTPVNPDGTVVVPPAGGSAVGSCIVSGAGGGTTAIGGACKVSTADILAKVAPHLDAGKRQSLAAAIDKNAQMSGFPSIVILSQIQQETDFRVENSIRASDGIMQVEKPSMIEALQRSDYYVPKMTKSEAVAYANQNYGRMRNDYEFAVAMGVKELMAWKGVMGTKSAIARQYGTGLGQILANYNTGGAFNTNSAYGGRDIGKEYVVNMHNRIKALQNACDTGNLSAENLKMFRQRLTGNNAYPQFEGAMSNLNKMQVGDMAEMSCPEDVMDRMSFLDVAFNWDEVMDNLRTQVMAGTILVLELIESLIPSMVLLGVLYHLFRGLIKKQHISDIIIEFLKFMLIAGVAYFFFTNWLQYGYMTAENFFLRYIPSNLFPESFLTDDGGSTFGLNSYWAEAMKLPEYYLRIMYSVPRERFAQYFPKTGFQGMFSTVGNVAGGLWEATKAGFSNMLNNPTDIWSFGKGFADGILKQLAEIITDFTKIIMLAVCILFSFWVATIFLINIFIAILNFMFMVMLTSIFIITNFFEVTRREWGMHPLTTSISSGIKLLLVIMLMGIMMTMLMGVAVGEPPKFDEVTVMELFKHLIIIAIYYKITQMTLSGALDKI